jgi:zinc protease
MPRSGTGTEDSVRAIGLDDLRAFYRRWLRPDTATLLIVGDTTLEEIVPLLEQRLGGWQAPAEAPPTKNLPEVALPASPRIFLVNRTAAEQSLILAAHIAPPRSDPDDLAMQLANTVLGGNFVSRLNLNLREDKRWSYGASTAISGAKAQRPFFAYAPVQSDKTVESLREIRRELEQIRDKTPITPDELAFARDSLVRSLPGENETAGDVAKSYTSVLVHELPDNYWNDYVDRIGALNLGEANAAVRRLVQPQGLTWVIVGDLARIEQPIRALGWGEVSVLDADGKKIR